MFAEQLWPNLLLFAAGQVAAWYYLHTGRTRIGTAVTVALWVLADWFLVAKFVFRATGGDLSWPLWLLQATAAGTVLVLLFSLWRRRHSAVAKRRSQLFASGQAAYLTGDQPAAELTFRRLLRNDPWDTAAWVALGNVLVRLQQPKRARRCYRRALGVDTGKQYGELVRHQLQLLQAAVVAAPQAGSKRRAAAGVEAASTT